MFLKTTSSVRLCLRFTFQVLFLHGFHHPAHAGVGIVTQNEEVVSLFLAIIKPEWDVRNSLLSTLWISIVLVCGYSW